MEKSPLPTPGRDWPFDAESLCRHDRPGPRYTSYPTAPNFHSGFAARHYARVATNSNVGAFSRPLSLCVHTPSCHPACFAGSCRCARAHDPVRRDAYLARLQQEIARVAALFDAHREVIQVYVGAGMPDFLPPAMLESLLATMRRHFHFSQQPRCDISIELNPQPSTPQAIAALAAMGFNRVSLWVREPVPQVQVQGKHSLGMNDTLASVRACRRHGLRSVKIDLVHGLPRQSLQGFGCTLDKVLAARPERLVLHPYVQPPQLLDARRRPDTQHMPGPELKRALLELAVEKLAASGYVFLGMDHYALPDDDLVLAQRHGGLHRNVMGYTAHAETDLIGLGVGSISHIGDSFSQSHHELASWEAAIDAGELPVARGLLLEADDVLRADVIQRLMCRGEVDFEAVERAHGIVFLDYFKRDIDALAPLVSEGLAQVLPDRIRVTSRGRGRLRSMAMCFDRYLLRPGRLAQFSPAS